MRRERRQSLTRHEREKITNPLPVARRIPPGRWPPPDDKVPACTACGSPLGFVLKVVYEGEGSR
jgi:hypothetical protein